MTIARKYSPAEIKTLDKRVQAMRHAYGFYDFESGAIELGCEEQYVAEAIWHETIHSVLFEQFFLEALDIPDPEILGRVLVDPRADGCNIDQQRVPGEILEG